MKGRGNSLRHTKYYEHISLKNIEIIKLQCTESTICEYRVQEKHYFYLARFPVYVFSESKLQVLETDSYRGAVHFMGKHAPKSAFVFNLIAASVLFKKEL